MIRDRHGRQLSPSLAVVPPPEHVAVLGPGYPQHDESARCYACGADHDEPCVPGCEATRLAPR